MKSGRFHAKHASMVGWQLQHPCLDLHGSASLAATCIRHLEAALPLCQLSCDKDVPNERPSMLADWCQSCPSCFLQHNVVSLPSSCWCGPQRLHQNAKWSVVQAHAGALRLLVFQRTILGESRQLVQQHGSGPLPLLQRAPAVDRLQHQHSLHAILSRSYVHITK